MTSSVDFDAITEDELRAAGSLKWTLHPEAAGAFVAEMDFGCAEPVQQALRAAVAVARYGYLPPQLVGGLTRACAQWQHDRFGWDVDPADIHPLPDVLTGLTTVIELFTPPGSAVIVPTPAYMPFLTVPEDAGRRVIQVPMLRDGSGWHLDLDGVDRAFADGAGLLILCNPHNPIGAVYPPDEMRAVADVVQRHGGRVFADEIHASLVYDGVRHVPYASVSETAAAQAVTATSASKAFNLAGLKCAQLILSSADDRARWQTDPRARHLEHGPSTLGVIANTAAYRHGAPWLREVVAYLDGNRRLVSEFAADRLPSAPYTPPQGTYLAWLDCRGSAAGEHPADFFLERAHVAGIDGALCGEAGAGCLRFNFATPRPVLRRMLTAMADALTGR